MYKAAKLKLYELLGSNTSDTLVFLLASMIAEAVTIIFHFPYDMIKCRLQSKNYYFKYKNLPHAFKKEINSNGIKGLYTGATPFFITYVTMIGLQFPMYETIFNSYKKGRTAEEFKEIEMRTNVFASFLAGGVAAAITNPLECITVNK